MPDLEQVALNSEYQYDYDWKGAASFQQRAYVQATQKAGSEATQGLLALARDPRWRVRCGALLTLAEADPKSLSVGLVDRSLNDPKTAWAGALVARRLGLNALVPHLYRVAELDGKTLLHATYAISGLDPEGCEPFMKRVLGVDAATERARPNGLFHASYYTAPLAAQALCHFGDQGRDALLQALEAENKLVRIAACEVLPHFDVPAVHDALKARLKDEESEVRSAAGIALCRLKDPIRDRIVTVADGRRGYLVGQPPARYVDEVGADYLVKRRHAYSGDIMDIAQALGGARGYALLQSTQDVKVWVHCSPAFFGLAAAEEAERFLKRPPVDVTLPLYELLEWSDADLVTLRDRRAEYKTLASMTSTPAFAALRKRRNDLRWATSHRLGITTLDHDDLGLRIMSIGGSPYEVVWRNVEAPSIGGDSGKPGPPIVSLRLGDNYKMSDLLSP